MLCLVTFKGCTKFHNSFNKLFCKTTCPTVEKLSSFLKTNLKKHFKSIIFFKLHLDCDKCKQQIIDISHVTSSSRVTLYIHKSLQRIRENVRKFRRFREYCTCCGKMIQFDGAVLRELLPPT